MQRQKRRKYFWASQRQDSITQFKKTIQYKNRTNHFVSVRRVCQLMSSESEKFKFSMCLVHIAVNARNKINKQFKNVLIIKLIYVQLLVTVRPTSLSTVWSAPSPRLMTTKWWVVHLLYVLGRAGHATLLLQPRDHIFRPQSCWLLQYYYIWCAYSI